MSEPRRSMLPAAEVALAVVSLATIIGMRRLFVDGSYFFPLVVQGAAAHGVAALCRRRGLGAAPTAAVMVGAAVLALSWAHLGDTTTLGVPSGATFGAAGDRLEEAWRLFDEVKAPAPVLPGFLLVSGAALWAIAWLADLAAFRLWTSFEALIPAGTLFVFVSVFAGERGSTGAAAWWFTSALAFALVHRTARQHTSPTWLGSDPRLGTKSLLQLGGVLVAVSVVGACAVGPRLPGAGDPPVFDVMSLDGDSGGSRQTVSPLVEIRGRLVDQPDVELFTVRTTQRAYWRLTSLDEFDGEVWSSRGSFSDADGELDDIGDPPPGATEVTQRIAITGLAAIWLPAAFEPRSIDPGDAEVIFEAESSTLIVSRDHRDSDGLTYQVVSAVPAEATAEQLAGLAGDVPPDVLRDGTRLPPGFPASVEEEARRVTAAATTPYEQALALQEYFRSGAFTYTLEVPPGHSDSAIEEFLFLRRSGYCEQFAGTYAAMARAIGLPARVAVGFTPGVQDSTDPSTFRVRGEHAHAWPEVWLPGAGWMAFEPTPGRGAPNAGYTGIPEMQDTAGPSTEPTTVPDPTATTVPEGQPGAPTTATPLTDVPAFEDPLTPPDGGPAGPPIGRWALWGLLVLAAVALVVALAAAVLATARVARRWLRHRGATTPEGRIRSAWADLVDDVAAVGLAPRREETPVEFAARASHALADPAPVALAWIVERADYAADRIDDDEAAASAAELAGAANLALRRVTTRAARLLAAVDPRAPERRVRRRGVRPAGPRIQISTG